jgi:hypothetical protein
LRHALNLGVPKPEKTLIARHIQEVIRQSERGKTVPDSQGRKDPATKTNYQTEVGIDGVPYQVSIVVRNHSDGKRYYDHAVVTRKSPVDQQGRSEAGASSPIPSSSGLAFSMSELDSVFNQATPKSPRGFLQIAQDSRQMRMTLTENANLSTFLHETGHFYLEVLGDLAEDASAA